MYGVAAEKRLKFKVVSILEMLHNGMRGLYCYDNTRKKWTQAHSRARFLILRAFVKWGNGSVEVKKVGDDYKLFVDESKLADAIQANEILLKHLNYYKAVRLPKEGEEFMNDLGEFDSFWLDVWRQACEKRRPRGIYLGAAVRKTAEGLELVKVGGALPTPLDVVLSVVDSVSLACE